MKRFMDVAKTLGLIAGVYTMVTFFTGWLAIWVLTNEGDL